MASSTTADPQEPSVTSARAPFDDADADLIIRCPDGAEFWVYKSILGRASPVFKGMSTLPPPPPDVQRDPSNQDYRDGVPVVHVSEDARTMELLLTFCYPMKDPQLTTFDDIRTVAEAGQKYAMIAVVQAAREAFVVFSEANGSSAYILAYHLRWPQEARAAARAALRQPWDVMCRPSTHLNFIDAPGYCKLLDYYSRCWRGIVAIDIDPWSLTYTSMNTDCRSCSKPEQTASWFHAYSDQVSRALREYPCAATATDPVIANNARDAGLKCTQCQGRSDHQLNKLSKALAKRVEDQITKVSLDLDFE